MNIQKIYKVKKIYIESTTGRDEYTRICSDSNVEILSDETYSPPKDETFVVLKYIEKIILQDEDELKCPII